jgi:Tfp pilus assembly protein PilX
MARLHALVFVVVLVVAMVGLTQLVLGHSIQQQQRIPIVDLDQPAAAALAASAVDAGGSTPPEQRT